MLSNSNLTWIRLLTSPFWSGTGISLKEDASVIMDEQQECITAAVKPVTPDMLQRVWSELDYRIDVCRVTSGAHWVCVIPHETMNLCNCSHQFCKNIPLSFDFITAWNQGVFLCSLCILYTISSLFTFFNFVTVHCKEFTNVHFLECVHFTRYW